MESKSPFSYIFYYFQIANLSIQNSTFNNINFGKEQTRRSLSKIKKNHRILQTFPVTQILFLS